MTLKYHFAHNGTYTRFFIFDVKSNDVELVLKEQKLFDLGLGEKAIGNLNDLPCGAYFDIANVLPDLAITISSLFPDHFVIACEAWDDYTFIGAINGEQSNDFAFKCLKRADIGDRFSDVDIIFLYKRLAVLDIPAIVSKEKAQNLTEQGNLVSQKMFYPKDYEKRMRKEMKMNKKRGKNYD